MSCAVFETSPPVESTEIKQVKMLCDIAHQDV